MYKVLFSDKAKKELNKMDKPTAILIVGWIRKHLECSLDPRMFGKPLCGNHSGKWRYRIGNYRIIADIQDDKVVVLLLTIGHRKNVY